ncbi:hypothetical protein CSA37_11410 [Candidatus Fermentibacteria bacterium]|nr:MAG: hypothetical protein CSA37_11410 [Candidatus Fermentibacteria bacterium]
MSVSSFTVDLDRIEEGIAVLLAPGGFQWHLPAENLPEGSREGQTFQVTLETDESETWARIKRIGELQERLEKR